MLPPAQSLAHPLLAAEATPVDVAARSFRRLVVAGALVVAATLLCLEQSAFHAHPLVGLRSVNDETERPLRVLITGYLAWGNTTSNPAAEVARLLNQTCADGVCFEGIGLPVNREGAMRVALDLSSVPTDGRAPWDAVVHLGFERIASGLRLELAAANVLANESLHGWSADVPCNKTASAYREIVPNGPCVLATTAPLDDVFLDESSAARFHLAQPEELWSADAGVYYCNEVLYRSLWEVRTRRLRPLAEPRPGRGPPVRVLQVQRLGRLGQLFGR